MPSYLQLEGHRLTFVGMGALEVGFAEEVVQNLVFVLWKSRKAPYCPVGLRTPSKESSWLEWTWVHTGNGQKRDARREGHATGQDIMKE